jgi:hypothetical protein
MTLLSGGCERDLQDPVAAGRQQHQVSRFTMSSFLTSTVLYLIVFDVVAQLSKMIKSLGRPGSSDWFGGALPGFLLCELSQLTLGLSLSFNGPPFSIPRLVTCLLPPEQSLLIYLTIIRLFWIT